MKVDRNPHPGELMEGVRPGIVGWYWCMRAGYAAPEMVYYTHTGVADQRIMSIGEGDVPFVGSAYDRDDTHWFGPISPPHVCMAWSCGGESNPKVPA